MKVQDPNNNNNNNDDDNNNNKLVHGQNISVQLNRMKLIQ